MPDNRKRDIEVFTEAIQLPSEQRSDFLARACADDPDMRLRIEALLKSNERAGDFLETPPTESINEGRAKVAAGEKPGDWVDQYKLLQQIGEGGCGVVFAAEQEEPVRRRVALKVVKPGMDTKSVIARFEAERQALALMDHPNIAHVFDAGATEGGRPYFVMELVEGVKITNYCDENSLSLHTRLELFVQVCDAIQHAHQKGIIHRDIKPSNILVMTGQDGKPTPKVIDFGIAKATTGQKLTDKTIFTAFEMLIGTPAYMSPEQAALASTDVDTRTDIYSLGVLLYELLTGTTPFDTRELLKAGFDEVRRVIRDEQPVRPSTRLSTMLGTELGDVSRPHGAQAPKLIREMRGELDWIVMKALEKERTRRYATANGLAMDIKRYLSGEAVLACPPSRLYQFRKLVSRHKLEVAALSIVLATLAAGLSITSWSLAKERRAHSQANRARSEANAQRIKAQTGETNALEAAARSRAVTKLMGEMFVGNDPIISLGRGTPVLPGVMDRYVKQLELELTNQPAVQADLKMQIGQVYGALGRDDKAEPLFREALAYYRKSPAGAEANIADALGNLTILHQRQLKFVLAEQEAREALAIENSLHGKPSMRIVVKETRLGWAIVRQHGKEAEAEEIFRKALATGQRLIGDDSEQLLDTRAGLATALNLQDKFAEAETLLRDSITLGQKKLRPDHPYVANDMYRLAFLLKRQGKLDEAETLARQCVDNRRRIMGVDHPLFDEALYLLALVLDQGGKEKEAAEVLREQLAIRRKHFGDNDSNVASTVVNLAGVLTAGQDEVQFKELAREFPRAWFTRSEYLAQRGRWSDALAASYEYLKIQPYDHEGYHCVAPLLVQTGQHAKYEELCESITIRFAGATNVYTADRMAKDCLILPRPGADLKVPSELAETAVTLGRGDSGALPYFECCKALAEYRQGHWDGATNWARLATHNSSPSCRTEAYAILAMTYYQLNRTDDSHGALKRCDELVQTQLPKLEDGFLGTDWRDWIIAHALQSEAKGLTDRETASAPHVTNPPP